MLSCLFLLLLRRCGRAFLSPIEAGTTDVPGHRRWNNASLKRPLSLAHFVSKQSSASSPFPFVSPSYVVEVDVIFMFTYFLSQESLLIPIIIVINKFFVGNFEMYHYSF